ncbi:MAG: bifunctional diguanylate cyclase/phosphodiesterase [Acidimicrobiales bacterium]
MSESRVGSTGPGKGVSHRRIRADFWLVAAVVTLLLGALGSIWASNVVVRNDAQASRQHFQAAAQEISSTFKMAIQHEQDLVVNAGAFFAHSPTATQSQFREWMSASTTFTRYPELAGIAEVVMVPASKLPAFEARALLDPAGTLGANHTFQITPPGARPYYCLSSVALTRTGRLVTPAGFDYCASALGPLFLKARDSGLGAYLPFASGASQQLVVGTPIYSVGYVPKTVQARRASFIGWVGTQVDPRALLNSALANRADTAVTITYVNSSVPVSFKAGTVPSLAQSITTNLHNGWLVRTYGVSAGDGLVANTNALSLLLGGLLFTLVLVALIIVLGTGRSRALAMVHERTDQLQHQALHDALTGLPNRVLILDRIDQMMARARRDHSAVAALFLDLDNFKDINDTLGHVAGDQLLVGVGVRLSNVLRQSDSVGRLGGDEFVILSEGASLAPGAEALAQRILDVLKSPFEIAASEIPLTVTASIGIAEGLRANPDELLRDADIAMYRAKSAGKHCAMVFAPSMQTAVEERRLLSVDLGAGLDDNQFFLLYQPTVNLADGAFTGVEALLRWQHPQRGVIMPDDFIPALESSGLIVPVGLWVLQQACRQGAAWHAQGHHFSVSVNVSVHQLESDQFVDDVRDALSTSGFDPNSLVLELTETSLMRDVTGTIPRLQALKTLGVHLAVDDFGTGYSSLAYLRQFPIDVLKIDRSFVSGIADTRESAALVHTLVQLGKALGLETIAEGVESTEQRSHLISEEVDVGQGFLFSRPLDVAAVDALLRDW